MYSNSLRQASGFKISHWPGPRDSFALLRNVATVLQEGIMLSCSKTCYIVKIVICVHEFGWDTSGPAATIWVKWTLPAAAVFIKHVHFLWTIIKIVLCNWWGFSRNWSLCPWICGWLEPLSQHQIVTRSVGSAWKLLCAAVLPTLHLPKGQHSLADVLVVIQLNFEQH